jgi:hypothetical protein
MGARGCDIVTVVPADAADLWPVAVKRLRSETNAVRRIALGAVLSHCWAEYQGDLAMLLRATVDEPQYNLWGLVRRPGPTTRADVLAYWQPDHRSGVGQLEFDIDAVAVDEQRVVTEGHFRRKLSGGAVAAIPAAAGGEAPKPTDWYLIEYRGVIMWSIAARGLVLRKDLYIGTLPTVVAAVTDPRRDARWDVTDA